MKDKWVNERDKQIEEAVAKSKLPVKELKREEKIIQKH
jgi:hypothetical protein